jgi:hypothetical protein
MIAMEDGFIDPFAAFDHPFGSFVIGRDDEALQTLSQEELERLKTGTPEERWEVWKILETHHLSRFGIEDEPGEYFEKMFGPSGEQWREEAMQACVQALEAHG